MYKDICTAAVGEVFLCKREDGNRSNPFAVAVMRDGVIRHVPRNISSVFSLYVRLGGLIICRSKQFSEDLPQGGLEIPCVLSFEGTLNIQLKLRNSSSQLKLPQPLQQICR